MEEYAFKVREGEDPSNYPAKRGRPRKDIFTSKQKKMIKEHNERVARLDRTRAEKKEPEKFKVGDKVVYIRDPSGDIGTITGLRDEKITVRWPLGTSPPYMIARPEDLRKFPEVGDKVIDPNGNLGTVDSVDEFYVRVRLDSMKDAHPSIGVLMWPVSRIRKATPEELAKAEPSSSVFKVGDKVVYQEAPDRVGIVKGFRDHGDVGVEWPGGITEYYTFYNLRKATPEELAKAEKKPEAKKRGLPTCHICGQTYALFPCIECGKEACSKHQTLAVCDKCRGKAEKFKVGDKVKESKQVPHPKDRVGTITHTENRRGQPFYFVDFTGEDKGGWYHEIALVKAEPSGFGFKVGDKVALTSIGKDYVDGVYDGIGTVNSLWSEETTGITLVEVSFSPQMPHTKCAPSWLRHATPEEVAESEEGERALVGDCEMCGEERELDRTTLMCRECMRRRAEQSEPPAIPSNRCRLCHSILITEQSKSLGLCEGCRAKYRRVVRAPADNRPALAVGALVMSLPLLIGGIVHLKRV